MGCAVNGPGEAGDADFGIAGGRDVGFLYAHGRVLKKVLLGILIDELFVEIDRWIADGMQRPEAAEDGEAGRARDGRGVADPARLTEPLQLVLPCQGIRAVPPDPARGPGGRRGGLATSCSSAAGLIRQVGAGLWTTCRRVARSTEKIVQIIREEMDAIGGAGDVMPVLDARPSCGRRRAAITIPELFRLDRPRRAAVRPAR